MISEPRLAGAGGEKSQCSIACPGPTAHNPISATRNAPPQPGLPLHPINVPEAKAIEPGSGAPLKSHGSGPLHTSFCKTMLKVVGSAFTVSVGTQLVAIEPTSTFC